MKFVAIVGTNAKRSYNRMLLHYMQNHFDQATITVVDIQGIPMFNENHPETDPEAVVELAAAIAEADGVIIGCPEYNHSVPSPLKSVIEWLSYRLHPFADKPVMIVGASTYPQGSSRAQLHLRQILDSPGANAQVFPGNEFLLGQANRAFDDEGNLKDSGTIDFLTQCFDGFLDFVAMHQQFKKGDA
ncbi:MAG: NAD(P)H-dependent oxidoreductase [Lactobacillus sp.]|nr:NAD(P)H-dependent oxidoreductase [Lactobacillus sp.]MCI2032628.1 NAD(P)H-dependent oxidoreductase [Lactobacillus sp.]